MSASSSTERLSSDGDQFKLPSSGVKKLGSLRGHQVIRAQRSVSSSHLLDVVSESPDISRWESLKNLMHFKSKKGYPMGLSLEESQKQHSSPTPPVLAMLIHRLRHTEARETEGLFRISPKGKEVKSFLKKIEPGDEKVIRRCEAPHLLAGALKEYLRTGIADFIIPDRFTEIFLHAKDVRDLKNACALLPEPNYATLKTLITYCFEVAQYPSNKMSAKNVAICMMPNLFERSADLTNVGSFNDVVELLITKYPCIF